jgi:hypothetical protein
LLIAPHNIDGLSSCSTQTFRSQGRSEVRLVYTLLPKRCSHIAKQIRYSYFNSLMVCILDKHPAQYWGRSSLEDIRPFGNV